MAASCVHFGRSAERNCTKGPGSFCALLEGDSSRSVVSTVADEVGDVGIDTPDQRLGVGERVTVEHLASFLHDGMLVQSDPMTKIKTTMYVDQDVLREIRVAAARRGRPVSELIDDALRESTLIGLLERVWARNADLSEADAMELANSELRAMRVERDAAA